VRAFLQGDKVLSFKNASRNHFLQCNCVLWQTFVTSHAGFSCKELLVGGSDDATAGFFGVERDETEIKARNPALSWLKDDVSGNLSKYYQLQKRAHRMISFYEQAVDLLIIFDTQPVEEVVRVAQAPDVEDGSLVVERCGCEAAVIYIEVLWEMSLRSKYTMS
jgi:hypothetical protein